MSARRRSEERAFRFVCLSFSGLLLLLALFWQIRLARTKAHIVELEAAIAAAEEEQTRLILQQENELSLEKLERAAVQEMGLQHPGQGQIVIIEDEG